MQVLCKAELYFRVVGKIIHQHRVPVRNCCILYRRHTAGQMAMWVNEGFRQELETFVPVKF